MARSPYLYLPDTGFPSRCLLRLAGLRWRYSNPPPHGILVEIQGTFTALYCCHLLVIFATTTNAPHSRTRNAQSTTNCIPRTRIQLCHRALYIVTGRLREALPPNTFMVQHSRHSDTFMFLKLYAINVLYLGNAFEKRNYKLYIEGA
jgi:hypothetical protein